MIVCVCACCVCVRVCVRAHKGYEEPPEQPAEEEDASPEEVFPPLRTRLEEQHHLQPTRAPVSVDTRRKNMRQTLIVNRANRRERHHLNCETAATCG